MSAAPAVWHDGRGSASLPGRWAALGRDTWVAGSRGDARRHASWGRPAPTNRRHPLPSANKLTTPVTVDLPEIQGRYADLDGYTVGFESYPEDLDPAPLFQGQPDDPGPVPPRGGVPQG